MLHIKESYYELDTLVVIMKNRKKRKIIFKDSLPFTGVLEYGNSYGVVTIRDKCSKCNFYNYFDYFFRQRSYDKIYIDMLRPYFKDDNNIEIILPGGYICIFTKTNNYYKIDDKYILDNLCSVNCCYPEEETVSHVFDTIYSEIKLRTAWKKLYFRCFRKSFSPDKVNGIKNIETTEIILSNILNHKYSI